VERTSFLSGGGGSVSRIIEGAITSNCSKIGSLLEVEVEVEVEILKAW
jgi:hypothetical protein